MGLVPTFYFRHMIKQNQVLLELLQPVISAMGYELWGIEHTSQEAIPVLRVYIDREQGITVDDCARVSHQITGVLEVNDPIKGAYNLEVSSPGLERPLFSSEHFDRFIGYAVKIKLREKHEGKRNISGNIQGVHEGMITISVADDEYTVNEDNIDKAHLLYK